MKTAMEKKNKKELKRFHFDNLYWQEPRDYELITLYQIGDLSCEGGYNIGRHTQLCYEISYVVSGRGWFETNGTRYDVKKGDIFINIPGEVHDGQADLKDPFRYFYMGFAFNKYPYGLNPLSHIEKMLQRAEKPLVEDRMDIAVPFQLVLGEIAHVNEYSHFMIKTYLYQILILTYRNFYCPWEQKYTPDPTKNENGNIIYKIINYIDNNLLDIYELQDIGNALGYSYPYLSRVFSEETGFTLQGYFTKKKMDKAAEWLLSHEHTITEIAYKLGYHSIHSFSKAFKKTIGISPTQYQQFHSSKTEPKSKKKIT